MNSAELASEQHSCYLWCLHVGSLCGDDITSLVHGLPHTHYRTVLQVHLHANSDSEQHQLATWLQARPIRVLQLTQWARTIGDRGRAGSRLSACSAAAAIGLLNSVPANCQELRLSEYLALGLLKSNLHEKKLQSLTLELTGYRDGLAWDSNEGLLQISHLSCFTTLRKLHVRELPFKSLEPVCPGRSCTVTCTGHGA